MDVIDAVSYRKLSNRVQEVTNARTVTEIFERMRELKLHPKRRDLFDKNKLTEFGMGLNKQLLKKETQQELEHEITAAMLFEMIQKVTKSTWGEPNVFNFALQGPKIHPRFSQMLSWQQYMMDKTEVYVSKWKALPMLELKLRRYMCGGSVPIAERDKWKTEYRLPAADVFERWIFLQFFQNWFWHGRFKYTLQIMFNRVSGYMDMTPTEVLFLLAGDFYTARRDGGWSTSELKFVIDQILHSDIDESLDPGNPKVVLPFNSRMFYDFQREIYVLMGEIREEERWMRKNELDEMA